MTDRFYTTTTEIESVRTLWEMSELIAECQEGFHTTRLYQFYNVYIEVVWHTHFNVIIKVHRFTDTEYLTPYLKNISIEGLF